MLPENMTLSGSVFTIRIVCHVDIETAIFDLGMLQILSI